MFTTTVRIAALVVACIVASPLRADDYIPVERRFSADELRETGLDTLTPAQLARLNQLLRDDAAPVDAVAAPTAATSHDETAPSSPAAPASVRAAAKQDESRGDAAVIEPELLGYLDASDRPLPQRVVGTVRGWAPGTVFELANGDRWQVLKGDVELRAPLESPDVLLVPGVLGRWFLQVTEDMPKARVFRVRD